MGIFRITGLDIGSHVIKAAVIKPNRKGTTLLDYRQHKTEKCIFTDSWAINYQKIVKNLKELKKALPRFCHRVAVSIPDDWVIYQKIQLDSLYEGGEKERAIAEKVAFQTHIPIDQLSLDYLTVKSPASPTAMTAFHVYACRKDNIDRLTKAFYQAGFYPYLVNTRFHALTAITAAMQANRILYMADNDNQGWLIETRSEAPLLVTPMPSDVINGQASLHLDLARKLPELKGEKTLLITKDRISWIRKDDTLEKAEFIYPPHWHQRSEDTKPMPTDYAVCLGMLLLAERWSSIHGLR